MDRPVYLGFRQLFMVSSLTICSLSEWTCVFPFFKLLIDFRKAFDSVEHSIIAFKLQSTGISENIFDWVNDYLSNRMQRCEIIGATSNLQLGSYGVPQGSLLGSRIFSIYVKDFPQCLTVGKTDMYADDKNSFLYRRLSWEATHINDDNDKGNR